MKLNENSVNALSLVAIQGANALLPLLAFPYLFGVLEQGAFARLVVAEALAFYVLTVCLYSFDISGVQIIVDAKEEREVEAKFFFNIFAARVGLLIFSSVFLVGGGYLFWGADVLLVVVWLFFVLGMILQSNYYFQAVENNWLLATFVVSSRVTAVLAVYVFVHKETDVFLASIILAGSFLVSGGAVFGVLLTRFGLSEFKKIRSDVVVSLLWSGRHLFLGNLSVTLFRGANVLILAGVSNSAAVAVYALSEKIIKSTQALARPLNQLFLPKVVKAWASLSERERNNGFAFRLVWKNTCAQILFMAFFLPVFIFLLYFFWTLGVIPGFTEKVFFLIVLMSPAVIFGVANSMFGAVGLSLIGGQTYFAYSVSIIGVCTFLISLVMSYLLSDTGAAMTFVLAEALLLFAFLCKYRGKQSHG
ncbi:TPA: oligosaccharide flippase family protein [Pseudomonas aeruginosa]|uniref:oligosaccharide flippase family protein n=1 Tax=Pseudomonas aeruginosa TaxID=287 RepID=UPI00187240CA|nr:oligosaccharide flippase family protein [Pseudomonas aeruginosa]MBI7029089.1 oligosaccharide flippase family protein [Pseudomonas aeruginosa]MBI7188251.1 oligosaccharide flippase family protein [Pseudomonas aeruginosa]MBI7205773.1 oligosaccharide flippase family protein [Pseudomonas aeruginosa]MCM8587939.1 oligosaccharide flippase family protein [Pseudomonas aeruginosa]MCM8671850.1 oligosaccharide flippase family protein [Pseudomonas aeruginosa]